MAYDWLFAVGGQTAPGRSHTDEPYTYIRLPKYPHPIGFGFEEIRGMNPFVTSGASAELAFVGTPIGPAPMVLIYDPYLS